ncbi:glutathione S-transferase [Rhodoferax sp. TH121]|uniref:glutathione S-transferase family protein n=1 Tax=Rhodoferax sp. TH121 TaxID=2022803 RepID=UPI000B976177|nr:glutathione S-transferase [Rhodoferax sp. TH121]OYQ40077.1 glutathione S-transferase [Rhodoferax sp. TH121]
MYKLHCFAQSGNSFKVAFFLRALGLPHELVYVDYMHGATREAAWRESSNEMGEAPILEDGARRITQSGAILSYLADKHGAYGGTTPEEKLEVLRWILFDNHKFTSYFASYRFSKSFGPAAPDPAVMGWLKGRLEAAYDIVNKHLAKQPYMVGEAPTIADFSLSGYVFYPEEESGLDLLTRYPHVGAWAQRMAALPGWVAPYALMPGDRILPKW